MTISTDPVQQLATLIKDIRIAMLTTVDDAGQLHSRPMATQEEPFDGTLWFFTKADSGKAAEVAKEEEVNLSYASPSSSKFVSVTGRATVVRDRQRAAKMWSAGYRAWFPDGLDDPELALLKVVVDKAEYWESPGSVTVQIIGFAKAVLTGQPYRPGEHERINLQ